MNNEKSFGPKFAALVSFVFALSALACGGGGGAESNVEQAGGAEGTGGELGEYTNPCDAIPKEPIQVQKSFWQAGFRVDLKDGELQRPTPECRGKLDIDALFYNRGVGAVSFDTRTLLSAAGVDISLDWSDLPTVEEERDAEGTLHFGLPVGFSFDEATLLIGEANKHTAVVPIGEKSTNEYLSLEPVEVELAPIVAGTLTMETDSLQVRADNPMLMSGWDEEVFEIRWETTLKYAGGVSGGLTVRASSVELELPDGTRLTPSDGDFELLGGGVAGNVVRNYVTKFLVPRPATGSYKLIATGNWAVGDGTEATGDASFTLDDLSTLGD